MEGLPTAPRYDPSFFLFSQILDGALCRAFKVQREFVSPLQVTHLGFFTSPGIDTR